MTAELRKIRVLVVDDSAIVRKILSEAISAEADMEVVGTAPDPFIARDKILALRPDVVTLDIEMPRMDGLTFLKKLMLHHPLPVIVISSLCQSSCQAGLDAMRLGAVDVLAKPGGPYSVGEQRMDLGTKIRAAAVARIRKSGAAVPTETIAPPPSSGRPFAPGTIIAIGASTGGTDAIQEVLTRLPADSPPIVIAQHIPPVFSRSFADRLDQICPMRVREAVDGDMLTHGTAFIAPGNFHLVVRRSPTGYRLEVRDGARVCYQRPSVDVLFSSVAESAASKGIGVLLTGMGSDGAKGLARMKEAGASTIAQDESTCVVFGMPREAIRLGAADRVLPLPQIAAGVLTRQSIRD